MDHAIGSKTLLTELYKLGYYISYDEVKRYKQSVVMDSDTGMRPLNGFTQWVADNVDHTLVTLDGKGTFHGMGIIECSIFNEPVPDKRIIRNATLDFTAKKVHQTSMVSAARNFVLLQELA